MPDLLRFLFEVITNVFFVPALIPLSSHRRHFALFVGLTQFVSSLFYSISDYFNTSIFLAPVHWHFISDVLTLTYGCLVLIHLSAIEEEETNVILRYTAFFLSWIFKYRDAWDSAIWESSLVFIFVIILVHSHMTRGDRIRRFKQERLQNGIIAGCASFVFFVGEQMFSKTDAHRILLGFAHATSGFACYEFWKVLPPPPKGKKLDDVVNNGGASYV